MRNVFLQLMLISLDSASWELHLHSLQMCGPMKIPKLAPAPGDRTGGPYDSEADALPHHHGHHTSTTIARSRNSTVIIYSENMDSVNQRSDRTFCAV